MRAILLTPALRSFLAASAAAGAVGLVVVAPAVGDARSNTEASQTNQASAGEIRPFRINVPEEDLVDLRRRIATTRWPDRETVGDQSQGIPLARLQDLVRHWGTAYDWRKAEAKLNALPQFVTNIDGLVIHFIHVRSKHPNALPVIMTHGWPGSVFELVKVVDPIQPPTAERPRTRSTSSFLRCPATGSPASPRTPAGVPSASREPGRS
jgi:hypothetical protein